MAEDANNDTGVKPFPVPTRLLGGVAWLPGGPILTGGADGKVYRIDPSKSGSDAVSEAAPGGEGRVRVLVGRGQQILTGYDTGVSRRWVDGGADMLNFVPAAAGGPVVAAGVSVCFADGADGKLLRAWHPPAGEVMKVATLKAARGQLDTVLSANVPRVVWTAPGGTHVTVFDPTAAADNGDRGSVTPAGGKVAAVVPAANGATFDLIAPSGEFHRHVFPETVRVELKNATFPADVAAHGFAPVAAGGHLVATDPTRKAHLLTVADTKDDAPVASTNAITGAGDVAEIVVARDGKRVVARVVNGADTFLFHAAGIDQAWDKVDTFNGTIVGGTLALSANGEVLAQFVTDAGATRLDTIDLTVEPQVPKAVQEPAGFKPAPDPTFLTFWPSDKTSWLMLMTDVDDNLSLRRLLPVADSKTNETTTVLIHDVADELSAPPAILEDGGVVIASAENDGTVRVHRVTGTTSAELGSVALEADHTARALALTGPPLRVAGVVRHGPTSTDVVRVWDVDEATKRLTEVERFPPAATPAGVQSRRLGWRGGAVVLTTHGADKTLAVEVFPLTFRGRFAPNSPAKCVRAAALATSDKATVAVLTDTDNKVVVYDPAGAAGGGPARLGSFQVGGAVRSVEVLSESTVAVGRFSRVEVFRLSGEPPEFKTLGEWMTSDRACDHLSRVDGGRVLATLANGDQFLLTVSADPPGVTPGEERQGKAGGRPVVVGAAGDELAVGIESRDGSPILAARRVVGKGIELAFEKQLPGPANGLKAVTAVAWKGGRERVVGLADGRLWNPPSTLPAAGQDQMVRAMAQHPSETCFAYTLTLDNPNRIHFRSGLAGDELPLPDGMKMEFAAPVTALAYSGKGLVTGTAGGVVEVWPLADGLPDGKNGVPNGKATALNPFPREVQSLTIWTGAENKLRLAGIDRGGEVRVWTSSDGTAFPSTPQTFNPSPNLAGRTASVAGEPNSNRVAVASQDGTVFVVTVS